MERIEIPNGILLRDARGELALTRPAKDIELIRASGYGSSGFLKPILESRARIVAEHGKIRLFDDLQRVVGYDAELRLGLTEWTRGNKPRVECLQILVRSRIVAMGVSVANLALGGHIKAFVVRAKFEAELERAIASTART